jgi:hypothetical protein
MGTIDVSIQGIIMIVSAAIFPQHTGQNPAVALAPRVAAHAGAYGITIPQHDAAFRIELSSVVGGVPAGFVKTTVDGDTWYEKRLDGERIQFGEYRNATCVPTGGVTATYNDPKQTIPQIDDLKVKTALKSEILPTGSGIPSSAAKYVAGWLDLPSGTISGEDIDTFVSEFRPPSLKQQAYARTALWRFAQKNPCVLLTPLAGGSATQIELDPINDFAAQLVNIEPSEDHVEHTIGGAYHFEALYSLLGSPPPVPPIPYMVIGIDKDDHSRIFVKPAEGEDIIDASTGVGCGPGGIIKPKP